MNANIVIIDISMILDTGLLLSMICHVFQDVFYVCPFEIQNIGSIQVLTHFPCHIPAMYWRNIPIKKGLPSVIAQSPNQRIGIDLSRYWLLAKTYFLILDKKNMQKLSQIPHFWLIESNKQLGGQWCSNMFQP